MFSPSLNTMKKMWSGHLGKIKRVFQRIKRKPKIRPLRQQPYRTCTYPYERVEEHMKKMISAKGIEHSRSIGPHKSISCRKRRTPLFLVDYLKLNEVITGTCLPYVVLTTASTFPESKRCIKPLTEGKTFGRWGLLRVNMKTSSGLQ